MGKLGARRGKFIVLDGPDGAGKTTQLRLLARTLRARGIKLTALREPGGTKVGEAIRRILLDRRKAGMTPLAEMLLFQAARAQLTAEVVRPALRRSEWVLCDRFALSTIVYQGHAGGVPLRETRSLVKLVCGEARPDLYVLLDVTPREGLRRRMAAGRRADRMEAKGAAFAAKVRRGFLSEAARREKGRRLVVVPAAGGVEEVRRKIWRKIEPLLPKSAGEGAES